jgi:serine/threonine protein kinase
VIERSLWLIVSCDRVLAVGSGFSTPAAGWPVLADFGLANWPKNDNLTTFCGTAAFIAPEVAASTGHGSAADWWAHRTPSPRATPPFSPSVRHVAGGRSVSSSANASP